MISYSLPFPPVGWFKLALTDSSNEAAITLFDNYAKMSYRNRYYLCGAQGKMLLTIPVRGGRNQHTLMKEVMIDNSENWQSRHLKTIETLYRRSPFYEFIIPDLLPLFQEKYELLHRWNFDGLKVVKKLMNLPIDFREYTESLTLDYNNHLYISRILKPQQPIAGIPIDQYYQLFADKTGFQPGCSILDYLFCEGVKLRQ